MMQDNVRRLAKHNLIDVFPCVEFVHGKHFVCCKLLYASDIMSTVHEDKINVVYVGVDGA